MREATHRDKDTLGKYERLTGKKALLEWWEQFKGSSFYDGNYVEGLRKRIKSAEMRILNGL